MILKRLQQYHRKSIVTFIISTQSGVPPHSSISMSNTQLYVKLKKSREPIPFIEANDACQLATASNGEQHTVIVVKDVDREPESRDRKRLPVANLDHERHTCSTSWTISMRVRPTLNAVQMEGVGTATNNGGRIIIKIKSVETNNTCVCVSVREV